MALTSYLSFLGYKSAQFHMYVQNFQSEILPQSSRKEVWNAEYFSQEPVTTNYSTNTCRQFARATSFFTAGTNFCGPSNWNLFDVNLLAPRIWRLLLDCFKVSALWSRTHCFITHRTIILNKREMDKVYSTHMIDENPYNNLRHKSRPRRR